MATPLNELTLDELKNQLLLATSALAGKRTTEAFAKSDTEEALKRYNIVAAVFDKKVKELKLTAPILTDWSLNE